MTVFEGNNVPQILYYVYIYACERKKKIYYIVVFILSKALSTVGTLQPTFLTPRRKIRISKCSSCKPNGI